MYERGLKSETYRTSMWVPVKMFDSNLFIKKKKKKLRIAFFLMKLVTVSFFEVYDGLVLCTDYLSPCFFALFRQQVYIHPTAWGLSSPQTNPRLVGTFNRFLAEPVSRDQILRHARGQGNINLPCSADHEQDWQPYPIDPCSAVCDHTYIHRDSCQERA